MEDNDFILKKEMDIKSDKNKDYALKINYSSDLEISLKELNKVPEESFKGNYNMEYILKNRYFSLCENIADIKQTLEPILNDNKNITLKDEHGELKLILALPHPKCKEIIFTLEKTKKNTNQSIKELYELINQLNDKIIFQGNEINNLKEKVNSQENEISNLKNKVSNHENIINKLKKLVEFQVVDNPWSNEKSGNKFYYTLKDNDYLAEKTQDDSYIHSIKTINRLTKGNIYKVEFKLNYIKGGDFNIGFGDFEETISQAWIKTANKCVGLTQEGLYIEGKKVNNVSINPNDKKYFFILDIDKNKFSLFIDDINKGEFDFIFPENIYPLAAIRKIGNSVHITTYQKN